WSGRRRAVELREISRRSERRGRGPLPPGDTPGLGGGRRGDRSHSRFTMSQDDWIGLAAGDVREGGRLRLPAGTEMVVSRIETGFLGYDDLVCFVEDSDTRWLAQAMWLKSEIQVKR